MVRLFEQSLMLLWPGGIQRENVLLFFFRRSTIRHGQSDKAGKALKLLYSTYYHSLHRVAEEIRNIFPK